MICNSNNPDAKIKGDVIAVFAESLAVDEIARIVLEDVKLGVIDPEKWYPMDVYLRMINKTYELIKEDGVRKIAETVGHRAPLPPDVDIVQLFSILNEKYHEHHCDDNSTIDVDITSPNLITIESDTPYPCEFDKTVYLEMAKRFQKSAAIYEIGNECRKTGGKKCIYKITW
ncbi:MAG: hypothetical protein JW737_03320 [Acidobacteria bacterium]|nr:hypothetical protein [Acidobacteriota bacterium]